MPVYEYTCQSCGKKCSLLIGMTAEPDDLVCPNCSSNKLQKLVSKFKRGRSEEDRMDEVADRLESLNEPDSPTEIRGLVKEMGRALDEDMGDEMEEMFESDMDNPELSDD